MPVSWSYGPQDMTYVGQLAVADLNEFRRIFKRGAGKGMSPEQSDWVEARLVNKPRMGGSVAS